MAKPTGTMRHLQFPLNVSRSNTAITPDEHIEDKILDWPTDDNEEQVCVTLTLSLDEYIALASCVDVGSDIAYGENAVLLWFIWVRSINSMGFCNQVNDCIANDTSTQITINNLLLSNGLINPDSIQPLSPEMDNRFPSSQRDTDTSSPPPSCDKDALWAGIVEMVERLDQMGLDFLEQIVSQVDVVERIANIIDIVPLFGDIAADVITLLADNAQDLENAYVAHSSQQVIEDTACALFELVCNDCRYPTYQEVYDEYSSAGISGIQDIASYSVTAAVDYLVGSNQLANSVVWYTMNSIVLYTLYLGGTFLNKRGTKWLGIWADIGEDTPNNGWELLCDGCEDTWCQTWDFTANHDDWFTRTGLGAWVAGGHDTFVYAQAPPAAKQNQIYADMGGQTLTDVSVTITGDFSDGWDLGFWDYNSGTDTPSNNFKAHTPSTPGTYTWQGSVNLNEVLIALGIVSLPPTTDTLITSVTLKGTGTNPFTGGSSC